ncbi:murein biosynthesis integral membrane protein MurJ [uncultured Psychroserpens sp.]|uniref:murein biosynthesis integral membrane protein MurJ n=1 Tax=uncultured Psychroserpens sp. TaxID=255436 RepID=UPI00260268C5|nr:lipid II flippase MurJ [uncultured Psychroserpens sp.]
MSKSRFKDLKNKFLKNPIVANVITVGITVLIVRGIGFFKEIVIADNFGLSELLDTFLIAILVPSFISGVFLGSFKSVFIPNYVSELKTGKNHGAFQSTSFIITIFVALLFFLIAYLFTDVYLESFFAGHTQQYYELIKVQFYYVAPSILFWGFSSLISGMLTIDDEFTYSSIATIFTPISIIICLFFFKEELGNIVLALGTLIGSFLSFLFLLFVALKRHILHLNKPDFASVNIKVLIRQLPAKLSSSLLTGINPLVDQFFSAQLIVGSIAALNYGIKIPAFAIGIFGIALGNVLLPYFSKSAIDNKKETFKKLKRILKFLILGSALVMVVLLLLSFPIISLVFERNAFTASDSEVVSRIQQMYLLQIPSYVTGLIMVKFLTSINKNYFMVLTSVISLVMNFTLNYILIDTMGVYGLALSTSLVSIINSIILYLYISHLNKLHV